MYVCMSINLPKCLGWGQGKAKSWESHSDILHGWQGPSYVSHHLLPARVCVRRKLERGPRPRLELRHCDMGCRHLNGYIKCPSPHVLS